MKRFAVAEILVKNGVLYLVVDSAMSDRAPRGMKVPINPKKVMAVNETDGRILWQNEEKWIAPNTLTLDRNNAYVCNGPKIIAYNQETGKRLWQSKDLPWRQTMPTYFSPTMVAAPGGLLYAGGEGWKEHAGSKGVMTCLNKADGSIKWQRPHLPSGYQSPQDIFVIKGNAWCGSLNSKPGEFDKKYPEIAPSTGEFVGYNIESGGPDKSLDGNNDSYWFHHRCHRAKATESYFLTSRTGIEMVDTQTGKWTLHHWVRGACVYGIMPANGMIYAPPHPCACYPEAKLAGFNAVSGPRKKYNVAELTKAPRLTKGSAYAKVSAGKPAGGSDWPTYRGNAARSGSTKQTVPTSLAKKWELKLNTKLSQPIVAEGKLFVSAVDQHTVVAIDQKSGEVVWKYVAGGRIDSAPTCYNGMLLFGCKDGHVYNLRASDGEVVWTFRAAPYDQRQMVYDQLESVWPVHGSVLISPSTGSGPAVAYVTAGRSMFLDGGITLYRLDPLTGKVLSTNLMTEKDPLSGKKLTDHIKVLSMPVASSDIMSSEGEFVFMRSQPFDLNGKRTRIAQAPLNQQRGPDAHLFAANGMLDDSWWHRAFWQYGRAVMGGHSYGSTGKSSPAGKIMVLDDKDLYVFGRKPNLWRWTVPTEYSLFSVDRSIPPVQKGKKKRRNRPKGVAYVRRWDVDLPILVRAMVKAADTLFAAGPADIVDEMKTARTATTTSAKTMARQAALFAGSEGSILWAVSARDGKKIKEIKLDVLPMFDGMIAAGGKLYMSTVDGKVVCLGEE